MNEMDPANAVFQQAAAFVQYTSQHIFLTGRAGTGKTTFLNYIREQSNKKLAVVAPTGVAAINARGTTLHSFFQLPFGTFIPHTSGQWQPMNERAISVDHLLRNLRLRQPQRNLIQSLELLIIDEVSMVRADVLDAIDRVLRAVRKKPNLSFGGVQMLFIGDLYQLPPVVRNDDRELLAQYYSSPFFFHAKVLETTPMISVELRKIYRQKDPHFINLLEHVRNNCCTVDDFEQLHQKLRPDFDPSGDAGYITLTTHNAQADTINRKALEQLPGRVYHLSAKIERDFPPHAFPADQVLALKEGAQVMFIKNDKGDKRRYYNGKIGIVSKVAPTEGSVLVRCDEDDSIIELEPEVWKNVRYKFNSEKDEIEEESLGSFCQFPLRLAWAVTIHKSQGLTFEKAVIDAGRSFAPGQVYVALSRLTGLQGLVLRSRISSHNILVDPGIVQFSAQQSSEEELAVLLRRSQHAYAVSVLLQAYDYERILTLFQQHLASYARRTIPDKTAAFNEIEQIITRLVEQEETAKKFKRRLQQLLQEPTVDYQMIHNRNMAAVAWFCDALNGAVITPLKRHSAAWKEQPRTKKYCREVQALEAFAAQKVTLLNNSLMITEGLVSQQDIHEVFEQWTAAARADKAAVQAAVAPKKGEGRRLARGETQKISLKLFQEGKTIPEIAALRQLMPGTIEQHLIRFIKEGAVRVEALVSPAKMHTIGKLLDQHIEATPGEIKSLLGDACSYSEINAVIAYRALLDEA